MMHPRLVFLLSLLFLAATPARAQPELLPTVLGASARPVVNLDFRSGALPSYITYSRTGTAYDWGCSPVGQLQAFPDNVPMMPICDPKTGTNWGWGLWGASGAQQLTWGRDLTNATWAKTNATVALDQAGADGTSNAASSILATAANATVIGSGNAGSSQFRAFSAYVKRLTGTGSVFMSADTGTNWNDITAAINANGYTRVPLSQGLYSLNTSAAGKLGFKLATNGDKIAVDFVQNENDLNSTYIAPSPPILVQGATNLSRNADTATINLANLPGFNLDSWTIVARVFVPRQWRGFGFAGTGSRRTILQVSPPGDANNALNLNFQADAMNISANCQYGAGALAGPSCPDVNLDSKIGGASSSKVRCSTAGSGIATFIPPFGGTFFTVAVSYDLVGGISIICNNGYGTATVNENVAVAPGFAAGLLTQMQLGGPNNFAAYMGGYLTALQMHSPALRGAALVTVSKMPSAPSAARQYIGFNTNGRLLYNTNGLDLCYLC